MILIQHYHSELRSGRFWVGQELPTVEKWMVLLVFTVSGSDKCCHLDFSLIDNMVFKPTSGFLYSEHNTLYEGHTMHILVPTFLMRFHVCLITAQFKHSLQFSRNISEVLSPDSWWGFAYSKGLVGSILGQILLNGSSGFGMFPGTAAGVNWKSSLICCCHSVT